MSDTLKYPIGVYEPRSAIDRDTLHGWIAEISALPRTLRAAVEGLSEEQLNTAYRPGGWTVRQVVHHVADSHMNAYIRTKLALTEPEPTIKPYREEVWAELADSNGMDVEVSLRLLESLHERWTYVLSRLTDEQLSMTFRHPESGIVRLSNLIGLYVWHGKHHTAHITSLRERNGW